MKIDFTRSGGFAGMRLAVRIDTDTLPSTEADRLRRLIEEGRFFQSADLPQIEPSGGDRFQYRIRVEEGSKRKEVFTDEAAVPETLRPLIDYLTNWARSSQRRKSV